MNVTAGQSRAVAFRAGEVLADAILPHPARGIVTDAILVAAGAALVALSAQVRIPLGFTPVPLTGQTFAVLLGGAALGPVRGPFALVMYSLAGLVGVPVFTGGGSGVSYVFGPTGGYLIGFVAAAAVVGHLARRSSDRAVLTAAGSLALASLVIYAFGATGLALASGVGLLRALELGVYPFVIGDLLKAAIAAAVLPAAWEAVRRLDARAGRRHIER